MDDDGLGEVIIIVTCPRAAVDLDTHAGGARMVTVGQETDTFSNDWMVQLLHGR